MRIRRNMSGKVLKRGAKGNDVKYIQNLLNEQLKPKDKIVVDGNFGPKTAAAVSKFQSASRIKPDGIVGAKTWSSLQRTGKGLAQNVAGKKFNNSKAVAETAASQKRDLAILKAAKRSRIPASNATTAKSMLNQFAQKVHTNNNLKNETRNAISEIRYLLLDNEWPAFVHVFIDNQWVTIELKNRSDAIQLLEKLDMQYKTLSNDSKQMQQDLYNQNRYKQRKQQVLSKSRKRTMVNRAMNTRRDFGNVARRVR